MADFDKIVKIGLGALGVKPDKDFSVSDFRKAFDGEVSENFGCKNYADFLRIKPDVFELLQVLADEYLPARLNATLAQFAEVRQIEQGNKYEFKVRKGHMRGKSFVTQVAPSGQYETFRLDVSQFTVPVKAYGAAAIVEWERFLNGDESFVELMQIIAEGMEDRIYEQIQGMLQGAANSMPSANVKSNTSFVPADMDALLAVVRAYGRPMIWCSQEFAATITNQTGFSSATNNVPMADLDDIRNQGYVGMYHGTPVIVLPQSFTDETNSVKIINPQYAYVIPAGEEKIVKVIMEGDTQVKDFENRDWSSEVQMYKKVGLAIVTNPNYWGIYQNTNLS
jgi:hypothetical protein